MSFDPFIEELKARLSDDLPAHAAHQKVMSHRRPVKDLQEQLKEARQSAVLILLYPHQQCLHTVFILRSNYRGVHSGQIAFPGGKREREDQSLEHTALREAREEVAVEPGAIKTLGQISPLYVPPSNFLINPFVGYQTERPAFQPETKEVAAILECPLELLLGENRLKKSKVKLADGREMEVRGFMLQEHLIWGATAMIVKEFAEVVEELNSPFSLK